MTTPEKSRLSLVIGPRTPTKHTAERTTDEEPKTPGSEDMSAGSSDAWEKDTVSSNRTSLVSQPEKSESKLQRLNPHPPPLTEVETQDLWEKVKRRGDVLAGRIRADDGSRIGIRDKNAEGLTDMGILSGLIGPKAAERKIEEFKKLKEFYAMQRETPKQDVPSVALSVEKKAKK